MRIETGTTNERLARCGIMTLALCAFSAWFAVDGWIRYPRKAVEAMLPDIKVKEAPKPHPKLAYAYPDEPRRKYRAGMPKSEVRAELGEPLVVRQDPATKTDHWHYVGQFGRLALEVERTVDSDVGKVIQAVWEQTPADYRYESIQQQKVFCVICAVLGLIGLIWLVVIYRTRVVVDETGLTYNKLKIPWDAMTDLDAGRYHEKGWLTLVYNADGADKRLTLDSFKIDAFDDVIDRICEQRGFPNPIPIDDCGEDDEPLPASSDDDESTERES